MRAIIAPLAGAALTSLLIALAGCTAGTGDTSVDFDRIRAERRRLVDETSARLGADEGGRVMLKAIDAHGGLEAWFRTRSSVSVWEYHRPNSGRMFTSKLFGEREGQRVYQELEYFDSAGAKTGSGKFGWDGVAGWIEMEGGVTHADRLRQRAASTFYLERVPFIFALQNIQYELMEPEDLDATPHDRVRISIRGGVGDARFLVYVNQLTGRVSGVRYAFPTEGPGSGIHSLRDGLIRYEEFLTVDGLTLPTKMTMYAWQGGNEHEKTYESVCREITFRRSFDESLLERPPGAVVISDQTASVREH